MDSVKTRNCWAIFCAADFFSTLTIFGLSWMLKSCAIGERGGKTSFLSRTWSLSRQGDRFHVSSKGRAGFYSSWIIQKKSAETRKKPSEHFRRNLTSFINFEIRCTHDVNQTLFGPSAHVSDKVQIFSSPNSFPALKKTWHPCRLKKWTQVKLFLFFFRQKHVKFKALAASQGVHAIFFTRRISMWSLSSSCQCIFGGSEGDRWRYLFSLDWIHSSLYQQLRKTTWTAYSVLKNTWLTFHYLEWNPKELLVVVVVVVAVVVVALFLLF